MLTLRTLSFKQFWPRCYYLSCPLAVRDSYLGWLTLRMLFFSMHVFLMPFTLVKSIVGVK